MKRLVVFLSILLCALSLAGCTSGEDSNVKLFQKTFVVGKDIERYNISEFYYTYENINYDAFYQRYHVYKTDYGTPYFTHITRERKNDYGPTTPEDTVKSGTIEMTDEQWKKFYELISGGTVAERKDTADSGDSGPWYYLYWDKDKEKYREYTFESPAAEKALEEFFVSLADSPIEAAKEDYPALDESCVGKWMGYFGNVSGQYHMEIGEPADSTYPASINFVWNYSEDGDNGMYSGEVSVTGIINKNADGLTVFTGTTGEGDKLIEAVLGKSGDSIKMIVTKSDNDRIYPGNHFELKRE
ncbi:MAG: hypothetical protein J6X08_04385 [Lachnospiraceae bacterium]|nr:hypothetical protein [Lachnospiraceae bacterium]